MPLRAKITNPAMASRRAYSSAKMFEPHSDDQPDDVLFSSRNGARIIQLNRPEKLNSLNGSMARKIAPRLLEWQKSDMAQLVVIKGTGRAFCAGGDVAALAKECKTGKAGQQKAKDYFALEYILDHFIATYTKPYVAFIDGITMGGGVGLSVHAPFRIATEKTVFAMPETTIGFFPDVGASFFLPKMDGGLGRYLALTSERLKGAEVYFAGIATHYVDSSSLPDLEARLSELRLPDSNGLENNLATIDSTISEFSTGLPHDKPLFMDSSIRAEIDKCFHSRHTRPMRIIQSLEAVTLAGSSTPAEVKQWAQRTIDTIRERSPTSVAVTLEMLHRSPQWNISEAFQHEFNMASKFMAHPDFVTGVSARLIDKIKTRPKWQPKTLEEVTREDVESFFPANAEALDLIADQGVQEWTEYPGAALGIGLPRESQIQYHIASAAAEGGDWAERYHQSGAFNKLGFKEKVDEVVARRGWPKPGEKIAGRVASLDDSNKQ